VTFIYRRVAQYLNNDAHAFYCPAVRLVWGGYDWSHDYLSTLVKGNLGAGGMEVIHYTGNPYYQLHRQPACRGAWWNAPPGSLLWDHLDTFAGGEIINHKSRDSEAGKNVLFTDGSVRWYIAASFRWEGIWPCAP
jgi:hypothetical protein